MTGGPEVDRRIRPEGSRVATRGTGIDVSPSNRSCTVSLVAPVIEYKREFLLKVPPAEIWNALEDTASFERWWPWLREFSLEGDSLRPGAVMHGLVVPPLPYRMRVDVELVRCERPSLIDALVRRDLEGDAQLRLAAEGAGTRAKVAWRVEMMQRPMRMASRVAHPLLRRGHDWVVDVTVASFRRRIETDDRRRPGAARGRLS